MFDPLCRLAKDLSDGGEIETAALVEDAVKVWLIFTPVAGYA